MSEQLLREFQEWLNERRAMNVSEVFHDIVAKHKAALAQPAEGGEVDNVKSSAGLIRPGKVDVWVANHYTAPPAPAQPVQQMLEGWKLVDNKDGSITVSTPAGGVVTLWRKGQGSTESIAYRLAQMLLTASPTPPAQQGEPT